MFQSTDNTYRYILKSRQKPSRRPDPHPPLTEHCVLCGRGSPGVWTCANPDCLEPSFEIRYVEAPMQSNRPDTAAIDLTTCVYLDLETTGLEAAAEVVAIALRDAQVPQPGPRPRASTASLPPRWPPAPSCKAWALSLRSHSGAHAGGRTLQSGRVLLVPRLSSTAPGGRTVICAALTRGTCAAVSGPILGAAAAHQPRLRARYLPPTSYGCAQGDRSTCPGMVARGGLNRWIPIPSLWSADWVRLCGSEVGCYAGPRRLRRYRRGEGDPEELGRGCLCPATLFAGNLSQDSRSHTE